MARKTTVGTAAASTEASNTTAASTTAVRAGSGCTTRVLIVRCWVHTAVDSRTVCKLALLIT